jgi:S-DNA-T family DNA segregation ATPase FtsK/SpoIIIE
MNGTQSTAWAVAEGMLLGGAGIMAYGMFNPTGVVSTIVGALPIITAGATAVGGAAYYKWQKHRSLEGKLDAVMELAGPKLSLNNKSLRPKLVRKEEDASGNFITLVYALPLGYCENDLQTIKPELQQALEGRQIEIWAEGAYAYVKIYQRVLKSKIPYEAPDLSQYKYPVLVTGYSCRGLEFVDPEVDAHALVGGMTGWGKTICLKYMMAGLMTNYTPDQVQINIIDYKRVDFETIRKHPMVNHVAQNENDAFLLLQRMIGELNYRMDLLNKTGFDKLSKYNAKAENPLPYIFIIIDEFADASTKVFGSVSKLLRMARFAGIHCVICTQRPDRDILPGQLKANTPVSIAFRCKNKINSSILLDDADAAELPPYPGRAIFQRGSNWQIQVPYIQEADIERLVYEGIAQYGQGDGLIEEYQGDGISFM